MRKLHESCKSKIYYWHKDTLLYLKIPAIRQNIVVTTRIWPTGAKHTAVKMSPPPVSLLCSKCCCCFVLTLLFTVLFVAGLSVGTPLAGQ